MTAVPHVSIRPTDDLTAVVSWHVNLADVARSGGAVVVAESEVEIGDGHDPNASVAQWRLNKAPETPINRHEVSGRLPDEQISVTQQYTACPPALPTLKYH